MSFPRDDVSLRPQPGTLRMTSVYECHLGVSSSEIPPRVNEEGESMEKRALTDAA